MNVKSILMPLFVVALSMITHNSFAQIFYVNGAATGTNTGTSWNDAYIDLQDALDDAVAGTEVWVAQGVYLPTNCAPCTDAERNISFEIQDGVKVFGGFVGNETMQAQADWIGNPTILSGDINQDGTPTGNSFSVVYTWRVSPQTVVNGFTIRDGCANLTNGNGRTVEGGGWYNDGSAGFVSNPKIRNVNFMFNKANRGGGMSNAGAFNGTASPLYENVDFISNFSQADGGGCVNDGTFDGDSSPQYNNCQFIDNSANGAGAGIFNAAAGIQDGDGNQLYGANSNPFLLNCVFKNNTGFTVNGIGGAIYNLGSTGGHCTPSIFNTLFVENKAYAAAAIYNNGGSGGLSSPSLINCTFAYNEADPFNIGGGTGGAVYNNGSFNGNSSPTIINSIFWGNIGEEGSEVFRNVGGTPFIAYSIVDKPSCTATNSSSVGGTSTCGLGMLYNVNPNFVDINNCDYRLQFNSPAIDAGDNTVNNSASDLSGMNRTNSGVIDLGPYETESIALPIDLLSFKADLNKKNQVDLIWSAINDKENGHFEIERAADGTNFEVIDRLEASNVMNQPISYTVTDEAPLKGKNYYRLKVIEDSGHTYYSKIEVVTVSSITLDIYPNPVSTHLNLRTNEKDLSGDFEYFIHNALGQEMIHNVIPAKDEISIPVGNLQPGMHTLIIFVEGNKMLSHPFIVTKL